MGNYGSFSDSMRHVKNRNDKARFYGLSKDIEKLPKDVPAGSTAYCVDTGETHMFEETTGEWYKQKSSGGQSTEEIDERIDQKIIGATDTDIRNLFI